MKKKAIITGITGQDGAYLSKLLIEKGYEVYGTFRRTSSSNFWRLEELGIKDDPNLKLVEYDLTDAAGSTRLISEIKPSEVYNLAAQSFVGVSFKEPVTTANITGLAPLYLLEAIRLIDPEIKFYQASSSEMFGKVREVPQTEKTPFYPRSPYGVSKLFAHWSTINYRESYGIFGCCGILFNHESPLRGKDFVTRKITDAVAKISLGMQEVLELGNLNATRDWGFAGDYVEGIYRMMQHSEPDEFVLATKSTHTVRSFVEKAFKAVGTEIEWQGEGVNERGYDSKNGRERVRVSKQFFRPCEVDNLYGDPAKARDILGWDYKVEMDELCEMMVNADIERNKRGISF
jgi:GDPmannose 4,6-dehydratase